MANTPGQHAHFLTSMSTSSTDILLCTLNARYIHTAFGLRYLYAQLGEYQKFAKILEFDISHWPVDILEQLLSHRPKVIGIGVYVWNARQSLELVKKLKQVSPEIKVILGGPEVSYESEEQELCALADFVIKGEADLAFPKLIRQLLNDELPQEKFIQAGVSDVDELSYPYQFYTDTDLKQRVVYVEASRGCPFTCEFCLSSLEIPVRQLAVQPFLKEMDTLLERGALNFKFVDRTFNLNLKISQAILSFFLEKLRPGLLLHFEMVPDRLPSALLEQLKKFPAGSLQLEIGIQTWNADVSARISRRQDYQKIIDNLTQLRVQTNAHLHVDLIAGLPGEDLDSFAAGFNKLLALNPHEIQIGILKRLRGTPIIRHDQEWQMLYSKEPPYEVLRTSTLSFFELQSLRRFARFWDLVGNSGNFSKSVRILLNDSLGAFASFMEFSDWIYQKTTSRHGIARSRLAKLIVEFLQERRGFQASQAEALVKSDMAATDIAATRLSSLKENRYAQRQIRRLDVTPQAV